MKLIDKIIKILIHTCEEKQEQTRDEKIINDIDFAIKLIDSQDDHSTGMRNGMRYVKSLIDGKEPQYELRQTDEEIKLGIDLGDEVVGDYGAKGVVVGIDTYKGEVMLSLLMRNHKVPQLVNASSYKTKTGRHFPQIIEVLEQIKGEADEMIETLDKIRAEIEQLSTTKSTETRRVYINTADFKKNVLEIIDKYTNE